MVRKMFLTSYARRDEHGDLDPREVWPESDELPEGVTSLCDHKKGLIDQVVPLCMQKRVSHARKTACQYGGILHPVQTGTIFKFHCLGASAHLAYLGHEQQKSGGIQQDRKRKKSSPHERTRILLST